MQRFFPSIYPMKKSNGGIIIPSQPAFCVHPAANQNDIAIGAPVQVIFGTERFDQGNNFAANVFTAPITGKYLLSACIRIMNMDIDATYYQLYIVTSNFSYVWSLHPLLTGDPSTFYGIIPVVADMDAFDTAEVKLEQPNGVAQTDISTDSYFSGALLC